MATDGFCKPQKIQSSDETGQAPLGFIQCLSILHSFGLGIGIGSLDRQDLDPGYSTCIISHLDPYCNT